MGGVSWRKSKVEPQTFINIILVPVAVQPPEYCRKKTWAEKRLLCGRNAHSQRFRRLCRSRRGPIESFRCRRFCREDIFLRFFPFQIYDLVMIIDHLVFGMFQKCRNIGIIAVEIYSNIIYPHSNWSIFPTVLCPSTTVSKLYWHRI